MPSFYAQMVGYAHNGIPLRNELKAEFQITHVRYGSINLSRPNPFLEYIGQFPSLRECDYCIRKVDEALARIQAERTAR